MSAFVILVDSSLEIRPPNLHGVLWPRAAATRNSDRLLSAMSVLMIAEPLSRQKRMWLLRLLIKNVADKLLR
jgi:hypothetical protein